MYRMLWTVYSTGFMSYEDSSNCVNHKDYCQDIFISRLKCISILLTVLSSYLVYFSILADNKRTGTMIKPLHMF
jgi:hypothetical protein